MCTVSDWSEPDASLSSPDVCSWKQCRGKGPFNITATLSIVNEIIAERYYHMWGGMKNNQGKIGGSCMRFARC